MVSRSTFSCPAELSTNIRQMDTRQMIDRFDIRNSPQSGSAGQESVLGAERTVKPAICEELFRASFCKCLSTHRTHQSNGETGESRKNSDGNRCFVSERH